MPILIFLLGLCVGSFLNLLADRLPRGESVLWGHSHCDFCKKNLRWFELLPVVSYIMQGGRCLRCHRTLSIEYPLVELATAGMFVLVYPHALTMIVFSALIVLFLADFRYQILPDSMIVVGCLAALPGLHLVPALGSFAFLYLLWAGTRGRGMGFGDVKFALLMGLFLGYPQIIVAFYIAFLTGAVVGVILIVGAKKTWKSKIAFGPFLIAGTVIAHVWGQNILQVLHSWNFWL